MSHMVWFWKLYFANSPPKIVHTSDIDDSAVWDENEEFEKHITTVGFELPR